MAKERALLVKLKTPRRVGQAAPPKKPEAGWFCLRERRVRSVPSLHWLRTQRVDECCEARRSTLLSSVGSLLSRRSTFKAPKKAVSNSATAVDVLTGIACTSPALYKTFDLAVPVFIPPVWGNAVF